MSGSEWDGVERRHQDHDLWAALDGFDSRIDRLSNRVALTDEEVFVLHQRCMECRPRRRAASPVIVWALLLGALAVLVAVFA